MLAKRRAATLEEKIRGEGKASRRLAWRLLSGGRTVAERRVCSPAEALLLVLRWAEVSVLLLLCIVGERAAEPISVSASADGGPRVGPVITAQLSCTPRITTRGVGSPFGGVTSTDP